MIDFGCKKFDMDEIVKCALGLTRAEFKVLKYLLDNPVETYTSVELSRMTDLDTSTVQKSMKKLHAYGIILRFQKNLRGGGYVFTYRTDSMKNIRAVLKDIIKKWSGKVQQEIDNIQG